MKRMMISVDLADNEMFEKEVSEAVRAAARQISREEFDRVIKVEAERIAKKEIRNLEECRYSHNSKLEVMAKDAVMKAVNEAIGEVQIPIRAVNERIEFVLDRIEERIDLLVKERLNKVKIEDYVESKVRQEVRNKVPEVLLDTIVKGIQSRPSQN